ncbi:ethanolamine utilization protein EutP [Aminipila butyrica]|uniref:Ethanolamine utilization protein EutP n=1 Tax=Aminipila butyrica TaxID=433296 RepID=A0A858BS98_9FIRM|nr:EutP/PduV family microcompartment system protein [Aminipila butyrica]QIB68841.1 ethanolamine utilization protein EutP [Aminipila butyrica]
MKKKRVMVIGPAHCGKTTLVNELNEYDGPLRKTQDTIYGKNTIDVPSSYVAIPWMYKHLIATAQNAAACILLLVDQSRPTEVYSPGFARVFRCPVIGVISKCDLNPENEKVCRRQLKQIGVNEPYFQISVPNGTGVEALKAHILQLTSKGGRV